MLVRACIEEDSSISASLRKRILEGELPDTMRERAKLFYVAVYELESRVLGIVGLDMNEIRLLCVLPEYQRRGIGRSLLDHIRPMVPKDFFSDIFVYSALQAIGFYRACGFTEKGYVCFNLGVESLRTMFMTSPVRQVPFI